MTKKKRHEPIDKARRLGELISLKQSAPEQPSGKEIASMMKGLSFTIGRKGKNKNE